MNTFFRALVGVLVWLVGSFILGGIVAPAIAPNDTNTVALLLGFLYGIPLGTIVLPWVLDS